MTVKQLTDLLSTFDPETEILCEVTDPTDYTYKVQIKTVGLGDPFDTNGYSGIDDSEMDWDKCYVESEDSGEETYVGPKVVLLDLGVV